MSKQLKPKQWIELFELYEKDWNQFKIKYSKYKKLDIEKFIDYCNDIRIDEKLNCMFSSQYLLKNKRASNSDLLQR